MSPEQSSSEARRMRLRYAGHCAGCQAELSAKTEAWYDPARKEVRCLACGLAQLPGGTGFEAPAGDPNDGGPEGDGDVEGYGDVRQLARVGPSLACPGPAPEAEAVGPLLRRPSSGMAGLSAQREYDRRRAKDLGARDAKRTKVRTAHPVLGGLILALSEDDRERQSTKAWEVGAVGERAIGKALDQWASQNNTYVLHDRRIPRSRANIDHLVVGPSGVWAIDAKHYKGRVEQVNKGGWFSSDWRLSVGGRDQTKLVDGALGQMAHLDAALSIQLSAMAAPSVHGMLCFYEADWPLFAKPFTSKGVHICGPPGMTRLLSTPGPLSVQDRVAVFEALGRYFPHA